MKLLKLPVACAAVLLAATVASAGNVTTFEGPAGEAAFTAATSDLITETFDGGALEPGLTITPGGGSGFTLGPPELYYRMTDSTIFDFDTPIIAFGAEIDTDSGAVAGPGTGLSATIYFSDNTSTNESIPSTDGYVFWGFTSDMGIDQVVISTGSLETYRMDNLRWQVPEPASLAMIAVAGVFLVRRRRRRA